MLVRWHYCVIERGRERYRLAGHDRLTIILDASQIGMSIMTNTTAIGFLKVEPSSPTPPLNTLPRGAETGHMSKSESGSKAADMVNQSTCLSRAECTPPI